MEILQDYCRNKKVIQLSAFIEENEKEVVSYTAIAYEAEDVTETKVEGLWLRLFGSMKKTISPQDTKVRNNLCLYSCSTLPFLSQFVCDKSKVAWLELLRKIVKVSYLTTLLSIKF